MNEQQQHQEQEAQRKNIQQQQQNDNNVNNHVHNNEISLSPPFSLYGNNNNNNPSSSSRTFKEGFTSVCNILTRCNNILVLTGAGISVSCGIPDFRSKDGIYSTIDLQVSFKNNFINIYLFLDSYKLCYIQTTNYNLQKK